MYLINKKYRENEKRHNVLTKPISEILRGEHYKYFVELNGFIPGPKLEVIDCPIVINNNDYKDKYVDDSRYFEANSKPIQRTPKQEMSNKVEKFRQKHNCEMYIVSREFFGKFVLDNGLYVAPMEYMKCEMTKEVKEAYEASCGVPFSVACSGTLGVLHKPVYGWFKPKRSKHEIDDELLETYPLGIVHSEEHFYSKYVFQSFVNKWVRNNMKHFSLPWRLPVTMIDRNLFFTFIPSQNTAMLFSVGDDCVFIRAMWNTNLDPRWCF